MNKFKNLHIKKKGKPREWLQNLFLKTLSKIFVKNHLIYKANIIDFLNAIRFGPLFFIKFFYLRFKYLKLIFLPTRHLYGIYLLEKISKILKKEDIIFFLTGGTLLGAIRQESFAGRPTDIDIGILESDSDKLFKIIPKLKKLFSPNLIRVEPPNSFERLQLQFHNLILDIGIYKKEIINGKNYWVNDQDKSYDYSRVEKIWTKDGKKNYDFINSNEDLKITNQKVNYFEKNNLEQLIEVSLYDKSFFAPSNPQFYLSQKYGSNWMKPNQKQFYWKR